MNNDENIFEIFMVRVLALGRPGGLVVQNPPASAGDTGLILGPGRSHMSQSN